MCRRNWYLNINPPTGVASWQGLSGEAQVFSRKFRSGQATGDGGPQDRLRLVGLWGALRKREQPLFGCLSIVRSVSRWTGRSHQVDHGWGRTPVLGEAEGYCAVIATKP